MRVVEARGLDDGGEKAKRGRGRPKLDTKDQNATEVGSLLLPNAVFWIVRIVVSFCCTYNVSMKTSSPLSLVNLAPSSSEH